MNNKVIYTCITGGYDTPTDNFKKKEDFDYILFSDKPIQTNCWQNKVLDFEDLDFISDVRKQRYVKIEAHKFLSEYDFSVYVDANTIIDNKLYDYIINNSEAPITFKKHPECDCVYKELDRVVLYQKESKKNSDVIKARYLKEGMPFNYGLYESNIIIRYHNNKTVIKLMDVWWNELIMNSHRDQLSLTYAIWKSGLNDFISKAESNNFPPRNHVTNRLRQKLLMFQTYYKTEQYSEWNMDKTPSFVKCVNTTLPYYPHYELNPFWSEFLLMKRIYENIDEYNCEYIGFDQYKRHFDYNSILQFLETSPDNAIVGDLGYINVYKHYCDGHKKKDIENLIDIISKDARYYNINKLLHSGVVAFTFGSCFIMKKHAFKKVCELIFDAINKMDALYGLDYDYKKYENYFRKEAKHLEEYGNDITPKTYEYQRRCFGYLAERLLSSFIITEYYYKGKLARTVLINEKK